MYLINKYNLSHPKFQRKKADPENILYLKSLLSSYSPKKMRQRFRPLSRRQF